MNYRNHLPRPLSRAMDIAFDAVGVNEKMIEKRRQVWLQIESNETAKRSEGDPFFIKSAHFFGSQSEGTTTPDLQSDMDTLLCIRNFIVIDDTKDIQKGKVCCLLIQDETTSPGYCLLQYYDEELSWLTSSNGKRGQLPYMYTDLRIDNRGRVVLCNSASYMFVNNWHNNVSDRQGPASHYVDAFDKHIDVVNALPCKSWPKAIQHKFRVIQRLRRWPGGKMIEQMIQSECFVVPTPSKEHPDSDIEWRISFASAERLLMFDLNTTQIRCYILLKYVKKSVLNVITKSDDVISSYICKTVLFHTISKTPHHFWEENSLLECLNLCLAILYNCIARDECPHFIVPSNNLLLNRLDSEETRYLLLEALHTLIINNGQYLYGIKLDNFGHLLSCPPEIVETSARNQENIEFTIRNKLITHLLCYRLQGLGEIEQTGFSYEIFSKYYIANIRNYFVKCSNDRDRNAARIQVSLRSSIIGSIMSSTCIQLGQTLSDEAFQWLYLGVQYSDVMSARLKLASALYRSRAFECSEIVIKDVHKRYSSSTVLLQCCCQGIIRFYSQPDELMETFYYSNKTIDVLLKRHLAICVFFTPEEQFCIPKELQYEMYKITFSKIWRHSKIGVFTKWMISATVSPVAYMYFLQYKLYEDVGVFEETIKALNNMMDTVHHINHSHLVTTLNLIGQLMEQSGKLKKAFSFYCKSLKNDNQTNAARILMCCNIYKQIKQPKLIKFVY